MARAGSGARLRRPGLQQAGLQQALHRCKCAFPFSADGSSCSGWRKDWRGALFGSSAKWGKGSVSLVWDGQAGGYLGNWGSRKKVQEWGLGGQGCGHSPTGHSFFLSAVIRGVATKELYPEFGLDVSD